MTQTVEAAAPAPKSKGSSTFCCCGARAKAKIHAQKVQYENVLSIKRRCFPRDFFCSILYAIFLAGFILIAIFAFYSGNPRVIINGSDYDDNICGYAKGKGNKNTYDLSDLGFVWYPFFIDPLNPSRNSFSQAMNRGYCVESCPEKTGEIICQYDYRNMTLDQQIDSAMAWRNMSRPRDGATGCIFNQFPTETVRTRCLPSPFDSANEFLASNITSKLTGELKLPQLDNITLWFYDAVFFFGDLFTSLFDDIHNSWVPLLVTGVIIFFLSIFSLILMRFVLRLILYVTMILTQICLLVATGAFLFFGIWYTIKYKDSKDVAPDMMTFRVMIIFYAFAAICGILSFVYFFVMIFLFRRLVVIVASIEESARAILSMPSTLVVPIITAAVSIGVLVLYILVAVYLQSFNREFKLGSWTISKDGDYYYVYFAMQAFIVFVYFWTTAYVQAVGYTTVSACIAAWYFSHRGNKKKAPWFVAVRAFIMVLWVHSGSLLFGSLLIAMLQWVRWLHRQLKGKMALLNKTNPVIRVIDKVFGALMWVLTKIVKFFNKQVFTTMAITGNNYCLSVQRSFLLVLENLGSFAGVNVMGTFVLVLLQAGLTVLGGFITWLFIFIHNSFTPWVIVQLNDIDHIYISVMGGMVVSFIVAHSYLSVFDTAIDAMFLCYAEDKRSNQNSEQGYYMPSSFAKALSFSERWAQAKKKKAAEALKRQLEELENEKNEKTTQKITVSPRAEEP